MNFFKSRKKIIITLALVLGVVGGFFNVEKAKAANNYTNPSGGSISGYNIYNSTKDEMIVDADFFGASANRYGNGGEYDLRATDDGKKGGFSKGSAAGILNRFTNVPPGSSETRAGVSRSTGSQNKSQSVLYIGNKDAVAVMAKDDTGTWRAVQVIYNDKNSQNVMIAEQPVVDPSGKVQGYALGSEQLTELLDNISKKTSGDEVRSTANKTLSQTLLGQISIDELNKLNSVNTDELLKLYNELDTLDPDDDANASRIDEINAEISTLTNAINKGNEQIAKNYNSNSKNTSSQTNDGLCWRGISAGVGALDLGNCIAQLAYGILYILSKLVGYAGNLLNTVMEWTVVNMSAFIGEISAINAGWTAVRDLVNIFFIFILLYIAISTILGIDEHGAKHALAKVIIFGILINFSMFFTKVIIDASNIFTLQFYTKITQQENGGMGTAIMGAFKVTTIFDASSADSNDAAAAFAKNTRNSGTVFVMGLIMILVAISVLLGATWIFLKRFVVFVFLLISSPLAFAGMILHSTEHYAKQWWGALMAEVIAAPALMIMLWLAFTVMQTGIYTITATKNSGGLANELGMIEISNGSRTGIIFNFAIITMLLSFCLVAAQKLGASGGAGALKIYGGAMGAFKGAGNWMGRNTLGAGAYNLLEKTKFGTQTLKQLRQHSNPLVRGFGRMLVGGLQKVGHGHHEDIEQDKKNFEDTLNELRDNPKAKAEFLAKQLSGKARMGGLMQPYNQKIAKYVTVGMKEDELATTALFMQDQGAEGKASAKTMLEYLSKEKQKAVQEMMDNRATKYHSIKMGEKAEELDTNNKQRAEHAASGQVTVDHGHGHVEILTGTKATNHINNLRAERDIVADIGTMFDGYTERQKSDILGTLSKKEQLALASSTDFGNVLKKHLTTYQKLENARKSGLTEELSNKIMDVGWDKLNRVRLHDAIKKATDPGDRARLITEWNNLPANAGMPAFHGGATGTGNYEDSQEYRDDLTNASAARNFTRMGSSNAEYIRLEKLYESGLSTPIKPSPERS